MYLGIDPAKEGAAVLISEYGEVTNVWSWRYMQRKKPVYKTLHSWKQNNEILYTETELRDGGTLAKQIALDTDGLYKLRVAIEDAYVNVNHKKNTPQYAHKINASVQAGLRVARLSGEIIGGLSSTVSYKIECVRWIMATKWRGAVLQIPPFTRRDRCKEVSLCHIPVLVPTINEHLARHGRLDHITDAAGVALWLMGEFSE